MNMKTLLMRGAVFLVAAGLFLTARGTTLAAEAKLVKIQPVGDDKLVGFYIDPPNLQVDKKAIVVWLSGVMKEDIQVIFLEGKTCKDVTANPSAFQMNEKKGCYVTSFMSFGETSSLQFMQDGIYRYYVATATGNIKARGTITVK
jgi:hypothetical protein